MITLIESLAMWGSGLIERFGYWGIFISMTLESAAMPIPSEVVVPLAGAAAAHGVFSIWLVIFVATIANVAGGFILYCLGFFGGRPILERYGKYILIHTDDMQAIDQWFDRHGATIAFFCRILPGARTFSSIVLGSSKVPKKIFLLYTFAGSLIWNSGLAYAGFFLGNGWEAIRPYFQQFELVIVAGLILMIILFARKHAHQRHLSLPEEK
jgi:membrane protein DedA with SNARE-associated domain